MSNFTFDAQREAAAGAEHIDGNRLKIREEPDLDVPVSSRVIDDVGEHVQPRTVRADASKLMELAHLLDVCLRRVADEPRSLVLDVSNLSICELPPCKLSLDAAVQFIWNR